jgi:hypothetical protein
MSLTISNPLVHSIHYYPALARATRPDAQLCPFNEEIAFWPARNGGFPAQKNQIKPEPTPSAAIQATFSCVTVTLCRQGSQPIAVFSRFR